MSRVPLAAVPTSPVVVPDAVRALAGDDVTTPVWRNELGGLTFRLDGADGTRFAKWVPAGTPEIDLSGEAARLAWVGDRAPVPHVLAQGSDDDGAWLVTRHAALVDALLSGDGDRAAAAFRDHIMAGAQMTAGVGEPSPVRNADGQDKS